VPFGWALQQCNNRKSDIFRSTRYSGSSIALLAESLFAADSKEASSGTGDSDASRATPVSEKNENFRQPVDSNEENIGQEQTEQQHYEESILCVNDVKSKQLYKSRLLSLPREILRFIWQLLALHDIKQVRLTCKGLAILVTPILFRRIVVVPDSGSVRNAMNMATHSELGEYVQEFVYDGRWAYLDWKIIKSIEKPFTSAPEDDLETVVRILENTAYPKTISDVGDEMIKELQEIFKLLPKLHHVTIKETDSPTTLEDLPSFYDWLRSYPRIKVEGFTFNRTNVGTERVCRAAVLAKRSLTEIHIDFLSWRKPVPWGNSVPLSMLSNLPLVAGLQSLRITFGDCCYRTEGVTETAQETVARFGNLLSKLKLQELELGHTASVQSDGLEITDGWSMFSFLFPLQLPELKRLSLNYFTAYEAELINFLICHAKSLESLCLKNIFLIHRLTEPLPCWERIFLGLRTLLEQEKITFFGEFRNGSKKLKIAYPEDLVEACDSH
jgi:hypothetical protein